MGAVNDVLAAVRSVITATSGWSCTTNWDNPNPPCVLLFPDTIGDATSYYKAFARGVVDLPVVAHVLVGSTNQEAGVERLYDAISPDGATSVVAAIAVDQTLGTAEQNGAGTWSAVVTQVDEIGPVFDTSGAVRFIGAKVHVRVQTRGDR